MNNENILFLAIQSQCWIEKFPRLYDIEIKISFIHSLEIKQKILLQIHFFL